MNSLRALLNPASIAIIGASSDFSKVNGRPLKHLLDKGYAGRIYPVNPKYAEINGLACFPAVADIPGPVDLAIVAVPAKFVAAVLGELGRHRVGAVIVFSSGFGELGDAGRVLESEAAAVAREYGMRLCGPNCLGLINAFERVIATFGQYADGPAPSGPVGFVTQSGAFGTAIAALARRRELGLGYFVNTGNESDVTFAQVMREVLADQRIKVGAGYIEGLRDGAELIELAQSALAAGKPLVLTKVGRSDSGARAAASHTGSLAGADAVFDGVIRQHGIIRARNEEHMLDIVEGFTYCSLPQGNGLGIITQSGGAGVLMADRAEELGMRVPVLTETTQDALRATIPGFGACGNPVDVTGQFVADPALLRESVKIVMADPEVHIGIIWLQLMDAYVDTLITIFEEIQAQVAKPFVVCWVAASDQALHALRSRGIAVMRGAEPAVDAVAALASYSVMLRRWQVEREALPVPALNLAARAGPLSTLEGAKLLQSCGVTLARSELARTAEEAMACAGRIGYPVALKIESRDIPHKTEAGGVALNLRDAAAVAAAFVHVTANAARYNANAAIDGVIIQQMAGSGVDMVIGLQHDPVFGTIVMAGLGGIHVEVLKDVAFRKAPVSTMEATRMLAELKSGAILDGVRGEAAVNRQELARQISAVSLFGAAAGARLAELDLNPVRAGAGNAVGVDWLMICR
ncbi:MAG: acetate--CoA ligase family protein [Betaproteobacteria bacterium]